MHLVWACSSFVQAYQYINESRELVKFLFMGSVDCVVIFVGLRNSDQARNQKSNFLGVVTRIQYVRLIHS